MSNLIEPTLLFSPEIKAAFPPTARRMILRPMIDYINMLNNNAASQSSSGYVYEQQINITLLGLQDQVNIEKTRTDAIDTKIAAMLLRISALENTLNVLPADAIIDLPANAPVAISALNLANIGVLSNNENEDRKVLNKILPLLRSHGWIKT